MSMADDLLEQARHLAVRDVRGRPKQANVRRAAACAYYAVFHFVIEKACHEIVGAVRELRDLRGIAARAFDHGVMKRISAAFASGSLPAKLQPAMGSTVIPKDLRTVAEMFRKLQETRHEADYDILRKFSRTRALVAVSQAERAIRLWPGVSSSPAAKLYLFALLIGDRIRE